MPRPFNFSAGPATLPAEVLEQAASEMLSWHGCGVSVMEMSHRGREFMSICEQAESDLRELLSVPQEFRILFMQGGGLGQNAIVPMNLIGRSSSRTADFVLTGSWSIKSQAEARRYGEAHIAASSATGRPTQLPDPSTWHISKDPAYLHLCSNETIDGIEFQELPDLRALGCTAPLVIDCSSHVASRPIDWSRVGLAYAGAQKNIGPAGLTLVFVRDDLLGQALPICPSVFNYRTVADQGSMFNTPPTYAIYIAGLVFQWLKRQTESGLTGIAAIEVRNQAKAKLLYDCIDASRMYRNEVDPSCRSRMNVPFFLSDVSLTEPFLAQARDAGLLQLKGHKSVGGLRASLYNAMPLEGVQALVNHMQAFEARHG
ncbi:MAG: 3-phosphoserine/phosphohydroxythreonine transaminase [Burkholderiaceae bacterium]